MIIILTIVAGSLMGQSHVSVFSELEGDVLLDSLVKRYRPLTLLSYSEVRDTMFSKIDLHDDSLTCVYTGHTIYLNPNQDPTQAAYMNGSAEGINTEHTFPQSMGAETEPARTDMHHLFPTRSRVNFARGNKPYNDIDDEDTNTWYYLNDDQSSIPFDDVIDYYSEANTNYFEPREDHKGDVARAMMYFYTMYKGEADGANSSFFESQREVVCEWHELDPVDRDEWDRNLKIAPYQEGKVNPFIFDCSLAARTYCPGQFCEVTDVIDRKLADVVIATNPSEGLITISGENLTGKVNVSVNTIDGRLVVVRVCDFEDGRCRMNLQGLASGVYVIQFLYGGQVFSRQVVLGI